MCCNKFDEFYVTNMCTVASAAEDIVILTRAENITTYEGIPS